MAITTHDLANRLKAIDEVSLLEILEISSEDLVDRFEDRIELKYDQLVDEFEEEDDNGN